MVVVDPHPEVALDDKYRLDWSRALLTGRQALVRLPITPRELDRAHGGDSYESVIKRFASILSTDNLTEAIEVAEAPLSVRGFGQIKQPGATALLERLRSLKATALESASP
jgi:hypothetical protein